VKGPGKSFWGLTKQTAPVKFWGLARGTAPVKFQAVGPRARAGGLRPDARDILPRMHILHWHVAFRRHKRSKYAPTRIALRRGGRATEWPWTELEVPRVGTLAVSRTRPISGRALVRAVSRQGGRRPID